MSSRTRSRFAGWREYPHNQGLPSMEIDALKSCQKLSSDSERLFVPEGESMVGIWVALNDQEGVLTIGSAEILGADLDPIRERKRAAHGGFVFSRGIHALLGKLFTSFVRTATAAELDFRKADEYGSFLRQSYTWSQLLISEEFFRKLMTILKVHPGFLDIVHTFGEKTAPVEESQCSFFASNHNDQGMVKIDLSVSDPGFSYEIAYNIKYVARHGRNFPGDPYSIRETGVYQKYSAELQQCTWVFLQPSEDLEKRLQRHMSDPRASSPLHQFLVHALILLAACEDWRGYINYLEDEFSKLLDRGFFTSVRGSNSSGGINTDFSDIRALHILTDTLRRLLHILCLNRTLGAKIGGTVQKTLQNFPLDEEAASILDTKLGLYDFQICTHKARIEALIARSEGIRCLIQNILDMRNSESNNSINRAVRDLTEQGIQENRLIKRLTFQTARDTRSMMIIAFVTAIFLPATFVATLFGSNFFSFETGKSENSLHVASNIWIYFVITLALSGMTVTLVLVYYRQSRKADSRCAESHSNGDEKELRTAEV